MNLVRDLDGQLFQGLESPEPLPPGGPLPEKGRFLAVPSRLIQPAKQRGFFGPPAETLSATPLRAAPVHHPVIEIVTVACQGVGLV